MNFLWVYGSEAHPEENPFAEGYESTDLGWSHPYTITHTMAERAQRALWMKTDPEPDFEIPMAVDFINDAVEPDDAIRNAYRGAGYYSAFVVDCDGIVKQAHDWGWYDDGGEWWGLPLAHIDGLRTWLDAYLANPPACFTGGPSDPPDGGVPDASTGPDGSPGGDAGVAGPDAGDDNTGGRSGGCSAGGRGGLPVAVLVIALLLGLAVRRRR